jgi:Straboviridae/Kyanoviridae head completion nuclease
MTGFTQGRYVLKNKAKYMGDVNNIIFRSSWELKLHESFDNNPNVLRWASEPIGIPYIKPTDHLVHKYYPDYYVEYIGKDKILHKDIIEVKPYKQTIISRTKNRRSKLYEDIQYAVNKAKWNACRQFCKKYGFSFRILTEKTNLLFNN